MKSKTINKILTGKFFAWSRSIQDDAVRKLVEQNTIITGGAIVSLFDNAEVNDFDVYFRDAGTAFAVAEYYVKKLKENPPATFKSDSKHTVDISARLEPAIEEGKEGMRICGKCKGPQPARVRIVVKSAGIASGETRQTDYQYFEGVADPAAQAMATDHYVDEAMGNGGYAEGQVTDDTEPHEMGLQEGTAKAVENADDQAAKKLEDKDEAKRGKYRVLFVTSNAITLSDKMQLILRFQGPPETIHENFDFVHATNYWTSWDKKLTLRPEAMEAYIGKELRYVGSKYPICSVIRLRKFISRGWTVNAGQIVKMVYQISKLDLNNPAVLEDQLVGVDSAYFSQIISKLREQSDPDHVDGTYLMTLIDKVF